MHHHPIAGKPRASKRSAHATASTPPTSRSSRAPPAGPRASASRDSTARSSANGCRRAPRVRHLIGASIGAWRFAAACCDDPAEGARANSRALYAEQSYPPRPSRKFVSRRRARDARRALSRAARTRSSRARWNRLHILTVRGRWPLTRDSSLAHAARLRHGGDGQRGRRAGTSRASSTAPSSSIARDHPPFRAMRRSGFDAFHTHAVALDARQPRARRCSRRPRSRWCSRAWPNIPSAPAGNLLGRRHHRLPPAPAVPPRRGLVLYPHFTDRIVPGWLDKGMPWRRARGAVARQRGAGGAVARVPRDAAGREAARPQGLHALRGQRRGPHGDTGGGAIGESERLGEAFLEFARRPDVGAHAAAIKTRCQRRVLRRSP